MELDQTIRERETTHPDPDMWRWSPTELYKFARMLEVARALAAQSNIRRLGIGGGLRRLSFVEAGSGIGTKLYLAQNQFDLDATGYEINDEYLAKSLELEVHAEKCDLREADIPWAMFDIVYVARPFKDDEFERDWERSVMKMMRTGAVFMSAFAAAKPYNWPCYYRYPYRGVWLKTGEPEFYVRRS